MDDDWLVEAEKNDSVYDEFYPEEVDIIQVFFMYVNKDNKLISMKNDRLLIENGLLDKYNLSMLIKKNKTHKGMKFEPMSILKYNIDLSPQEVDNFVNYSKNFDFLTCEKNIKDLIWKESIPLFKDINSLYILYYQVNKNFKRNLTKRIKLKNHRKKTRKTNY